MARGSNSQVDRFAVGEAIAIATAAEPGGAGLKVIQLLKMGAHPTRNGKPPIVRVDGLSHAQQIAAATANYHRSNDMVIDYDHQTVFGARAGVGGQARAAGWSTKVFATEQGVFAEVDWNEEAASALDRRDYRYISPVFTHDAQGRPLCIINAALTNTPSLDLVAVATAFASSLNGVENMNLASIAKALGLGEDASEEEILRAIANMNSAPAAMTAIATALGVADGADLVAAATALKSQAATPDPTKFVPVAVVTEMQTSIQSLQGDVDTFKAKERQGKIDDAQAAGRLTPAMAAHMATIADTAQLDGLLASLPANGLGKAAVEGEPGSGKGPLDAAEIAVATAMGMTPEEFIAERDGDKEGSK